MRLVDRMRFGVVAGGLALLGGCDSGSSPLEHATVHGKVTYKGKPVTFGSVMFVPVSPPKDEAPTASSGTIGADGAYELKSATKAGAVVGEHKVVVFAVDAGKPAASASAADGDPLPPPSPAGGPSKTAKANTKSAVPAKYTDPSTTPLTRKVDRGDNTIDLELVD